ncbi:MAG: DUF6796 family protein [Myxococcota bacterium]
MARPLALVGIAGSLLMLIDSLILGAHGLPGPKAWEEGVRAAAELSVVSTFIGGTLGAFGAVLAMLGLVPLFQVLQPAGRPLAWIAACGLAGWLALYGVHHGMRPLVAHLLRVEPLALDSMMFARALAYLNVQRSMGGVGLFAGSLFFFFTTLFRRTELPRWSVVTTPLFWVPGLFVARSLPAPLAGPYLAGWLDLICLPLFAVLLISPRRRS